MTRDQMAYVVRANERLKQPIELSERVKILRTLSQMFTAEANTLEQRLVDLAGY